MAEQKPLIIKNGEISQLQGGDVVCVDQEIIFGSETIDGSWKFIISGEELSVRRREGGNWIEKGAFLP